MVSSVSRHVVQSGVAQDETGPRFDYDHPATASSYNDATACQSFRTRRGVIACCVANGQQRFGATVHCSR